MSPRRSSRPKSKSRPIILPQSLGAPPANEDRLLTGAQAKQIQELIDLLRRNNLTELELERHGVRIRVRHEVSVKGLSASVQETAPAGPSSAGQPAAAAGPVQEEASGFVTITSPIVGTFYRSASGDGDR